MLLHIQKFTKEIFIYIKVFFLQGRVSYIRSGNQIKRDGYFFAVLYMLYKITKSKQLFRLYNRRHIIDLETHPKKIWFYTSVACNSDNSMGQVVSFLDSMPDNHAVILLFHSILKPADKGWGKDRWYNSTIEFEKLCRWLRNKKGIEVITNKELHNKLFGGGN